MKGRRKNGKRDCNYCHPVYGGVCHSKGAMREPQGYRETLEYLTTQTGKGWLSTTEIATILGIDRHTVNKRFGIKSGCALPILAMKLAQESK